MCAARGSSETELVEDDTLLVFEDPLAPQDGPRTTENWVESRGDASVRVQRYDASRVARAMI